MYSSENNGHSEVQFSAYKSKNAHKLYNKIDIKLGFCIGGNVLWYIWLCMCNGLLLCSMECNELRAGIPDLFHQQVRSLSTMYVNAFYSIAFVPSNPFVLLFSSIVKMI